MFNPIRFLFNKLRDFIKSKITKENSHKVLIFAGISLSLFFGAKFIFIKRRLKIITELFETNRNALQIVSRQSYELTKDNEFLAEVAGNLLGIPVKAYA